VIIALVSFLLSIGHGLARCAQPPSKSRPVT
jgi:hypothetical protein